MVDFGELKDKAEGFAGTHSEQVKQGIDKVGGFAGDRLGHDKVDPVEAKLSGFVDGLGGHQGAETPAPTE